MPDREDKLFAGLIRLGLSPRVARFVYFYYDDQHRLRVVPETPEEKAYYEYLKAFKERKDLFVEWRYKILERMRKDPAFKEDGLELFEEARREDVRRFQDNFGKEAYDFLMDGFDEEHGIIRGVNDYVFDYYTEEGRVYSENDVTYWSMLEPFGGYRNVYLVADTRDVGEGNIMFSPIDPYIDDVLFDLVFSGGRIPKGEGYEKELFERTLGKLRERGVENPEKLHFFRDKEEQEAFRKRLSDILDRVDIVDSESREWLSFIRLSEARKKATWEEWKALHGLIIARPEEKYAGYFEVRIRKPVPLRKVKRILILYDSDYAEGSLSKWFDGLRKAGFHGKVGIVDITRKKPRLGAIVDFSSGEPRITGGNRKYMSSYLVEELEKAVSGK